jgi:hypothetical protein
MPTWSNRERAKPIHPSPAHAAGDSSHTHTLHPVNLQQLGRGEKMRENASKLIGKCHTKRIVGVGDRLSSI